MNNSLHTYKAELHSLVKIYIDFDDIFLLIQAYVHNSRYSVLAVVYTFSTTYHFNTS